MQIGDMKVSAEAFYARTEIYGLSFWSWEGRSAQVIATRVGTGRLPYPVLRKSTAGAVRALTAAGGLASPKPGMTVTTLWRFQLRCRTMTSRC